MIRTIISGALLIASGGIFFVYTQPTYDASGKTKGEIAQYDVALTKSSELQQLKQTLLARYNSFDPNNVERLHKMLPDHVDNVRLILDLDNLGAVHGLALQNIVVSAPQAEATSQSAAAAISTSGKSYDSLTLTFTTIATYDQFLQFLADLQSSLRVVDLVSLRMGASGAAVGKATPTYTFDVTLRTYWLK